MVAMERICPPNKMVPAEPGTVCYVKDACPSEPGAERRRSGGEEGKTTYIQVSHDKDQPSWVTTGEFFAVVFRDKLDHPLFMNSCLDTYRARMK